MRVMSILQNHGLHSPSLSPSSSQATPNRLNRSHQIDNKKTPIRETSTTGNKNILNQNKKIKTPIRGTSSTGNKNILNQNKKIKTPIRETSSTSSTNIYNQIDKIKTPSSEKSSQDGEKRTPLRDTNSIRKTSNISIDYMPTDKSDRSRKSLFDKKSFNLHLSPSSSIRSASPPSRSASLHPRSASPPSRSCKCSKMILNLASIQNDLKLLLKSKKLNENFPLEVVIKIINNISIFKYFLYYFTI
jgi:hypothetical protein